MRRTILTFSVLVAVFGGLTGTVFAQSDNSIVTELGPLPQNQGIDDAVLTDRVSQRQQALLVLDERMDILVRMVASDEGPDPMWQVVFDEAAMLRQGALSDPNAMAEYRALVATVEIHLLPQAVAELPGETVSVE